MAMEWGEAREEMCRPYLIFVRRDGSVPTCERKVGVAVLCAASVEHVRKLCVPARECVGAAEGGTSCLVEDRGGMCFARAEGDGSGGGGRRSVCGCKVLDGVCRQLFVLQERFYGVFPLGAEHWWAGATDGVDGADSSATGWLVCAH
jgi:hypothetical protein